MNCVSAQLHTSGYGEMFWPVSDKLSVTLSVGSALPPYGIAYRRDDGLCEIRAIQDLALKPVVWEGNVWEVPQTGK
jgi:hypothetical protein